MHKATNTLIDDEILVGLIQQLEQLSVDQTEWLINFLKQQNENSSTIDINNKVRSAVVYATETGNSKGIAERLFDTAQKHNKSIELIDFAELKLRHILKFDQLLIVCSTHGDGDPPEPIELVYNDLMTSVISLEKLSFAVLALGDSTYEKFCETGKKIDQKLFQLNATRLLPCVECDVGFEEEAKIWIDKIVKLIPAQTEIDSKQVKTKPSINELINKNNPLVVKVIENLRLTSEKRRNAIHHIELALESNQIFSISPGDSIGVIARNPSELVNTILNLVNLTGNESVNLKMGTLSLREALSDHCDLNVISSKLLENWSILSKDNELHLLLQGDNKNSRTFTKQNYLSELLTNYPAQIEPQTFVNLLRPLQPRLYDLANSTKYINDEAHILVERYIYQHASREYVGIASNYLVGLSEEDVVSIYPHPNKRFHLPINQTVPLILIADGTGIAPFRAFIQEVSIDNKRQHPIWLFFQERYFKEDFLYQAEWLKFIETENLTRLDIAFYKDNSELKLFDLVKQNYSQFKGWLISGAHIYLSGHKSELELFESLLNAGIASDPEISSEWQIMSKNGRIHRNLY